MKHKIIAVFSALVMLCSVAFAACSNDDEKAEVYIAQAQISQTAEGVCTAYVVLDDDSSDKFAKETALSEASYELTGSLSQYANAEFTLSGVQVARVDDKTAKVTFVTPFVDRFDAIYRLYTESAVTTNGAGLCIYMTGEKPDIALTGECSGAYYGADTLTLDLTFIDEGKFVSDLSSDMFKLPQGFGAGLSVERVSDDEARVTITDMPEISSQYFDVVVSADAIDNPFAEDITLNVSYYHPYVGDGERELTEDALKVTGAQLPDGLKGQKGGLSLLSVAEQYVTIAEQDYDAEGNTYSYTLTRTGAAKDKNLTMQALTEILSVNAKLTSEYETFTYSFSVAGAQPYVYTSAEQDYDNDTVTVSVSIIGGSFANDLTKEDLTISGASAFGKVEVQNVTASGFDLVFSEYTAGATGYLVNVIIPQTAVAGSDENITLSLFVPTYDDVRDIDWAALGTKLGKSAATSAVGALASAGVDFALPYIYDFFGIDTTDPDVAEIKKQLQSLTLAVDNIAHDVQNVTSAIKQSSQLQILNDFQSAQTILLSTYRTLLSNSDVIAYVKAYNGDSGASWTDLANNAIALSACYEIESILEAKGFKLSTAYDGWYDMYNNLVDNCISNNYNLNLENLYDMLQFMEEDLKPMDLETCQKVLGVLRESASAGEYNSELSANKPSGDTVTNFKNAVYNLQIANGYVASVINFGSQIMSTSAGLSKGVIGLYFDSINNIYNFESQTISAKTAFVSVVQNVYMTNAAIALQYCAETGDTNAAALRTQIAQVFDVLDAAYAEIDAMTARATKGNDVILVTGSTVSKTMSAYKPKDVDYFSPWSFSDGGVILSLDNMYDLAQRAAERGLSLAQDLVSAGFSNVTANDSATSQYVYFCGNVSSEDKESTGMGVLKTLGSVFSNAEYLISDLHFYGNFLTQSGTSAASRLNNQEFYRDRHYTRVYGKSRYVEDYTYTTILFFMTAK